MNVIVFLALAALMCATASSSRSPATPQWHELTPSYSFDEYVRHFNKPYKQASDEYARRAKIFERNLAEILSHNSRPDASWKAGLSQFTDMTKEEVRVRHGYRKDLAQHYRANPSRFESTLAADSRLHAFTSGVVSEEQLLASLPTHVDWREKGAVTAVKDQGHCGSCYSFATAETVESHYFLKTGELAVLAPLQAASCTDNPEHCGGTGGCQGGIPEKCFESIITKGGLSSEWTYPYTSYFGDNFACNDSRIVPVAKLSSFTKLPNNSYTALMTAVATVGPVAIAVDANGWHNYESGVFDSCNMESPLIDHNVQLVGYGVDEQSGTPYWLVRNSWAPHWGENGYIRIRRYPDDASRPCGIDTDPGSGSGCDNGPSTQRVCGMCGILSDSSYPIISN